MGNGATPQEIQDALDKAKKQDKKKEPFPSPLFLWIFSISAIVLTIVLLILSLTKTITINSTILTLVAFFLVIPIIPHITKLKFGDVEIVAGQAQEDENSAKTEQVKTDNEKALPQLEKKDFDSSIWQISTADPLAGIVMLKDAIETKLTENYGAPENYGVIQSIDNIRDSKSSTRDLSTYVSGAIKDVYPLISRVAVGSKIKKEDAVRLVTLGMQIIKALENPQKEANVSEFLQG